MLKINERLFLASSVLFICLLTNIKTLAQQQAINTDSIQNFSVGLYWNAHSIFNNYTAWELSSQFMWKNRISIDLGAGYVSDSERYSSEIFASSKEYIDHKTGFSLTGEIKYFFYKTQNNNGPYVGFGYRHLETSYTANYIVRIDDGSNRYFQYFNEDYFIRQDQFNAKFGYRLMGKDERVFFEFGGSIGFRKKHISPSPEKINGRLMTNKKFLSGLTQYPLPYSIDVKIGLVLFSN